MNDGVPQTTPRDGEWKPEHYALLERIQRENRCGDVVCVHPDDGHCHCMDQFKEAARG